MQQPIFIACEVNFNGGEGRLAYLYALRKYGKKCEVPDGQSVAFAEPGDLIAPSIITTRRWQRSLRAYCWLLVQMVRLRFGKERPVVVLNYLPLWNFLFFLVVPRYVEMAPITGGGRINFKHLYLPFDKLLRVRFTRGFVIPVLYRLAVFLINGRKLCVKPATHGVARALGLRDIPPRIIETDESPFMLTALGPTGKTFKNDLIVYISDHVLKNRTLSSELVKRLAEGGVKLVVVGGDVNIDHGNVTVLHNVPRKAVLEAMTNCHAALSLSLEQGGFFAFEANACGLPVLCLPDSGGARLPGAIALLSSSEHATPELLTSRIHAALAKVRMISQQDRQGIVSRTRKVMDEAVAYFY